MLSDCVVVNILLKICWDNPLHLNVFSELKLICNNECDKSALDLISVCYHAETKA